MIKKRLIALASILLTGAFLFSACNFGAKAPEKSAEDVVKESMQKMKEVKSAHYDFAFNGTLEATKEDLGFKKIGFNGSLIGGYNFKDLANPKFSTDLDVSGSIDDEEKVENFKGELRLTDKKGYAVLKDLTDFQGNIPPMFVEPFKGQWFSMSLPDETFDSMSIAYKDDAELTETEKQLKALTENLMLYKDLKYESTESVDGVESYKYTFTLDNDSLMKFLDEYFKMSGETMPEDSKAEMETTFKKLNMEGALWIGKDDMLMRKMTGTLSMKDLEGVDLSLEITETLSKFGEDNAVEVPKDATEFDPATIFGGVTP